MSVKPELPVNVIVTIELSNGHFKSSLSQPLGASIEEKQRFVEKWLELMAFGLRNGCTDIVADFAEAKP